MNTRENLRLPIILATETCETIALDRSLNQGLPSPRLLTTILRRVSALPLQLFFQSKPFCISQRRNQTTNKRVDNDASSTPLKIVNSDSNLC